MESGCECVSEQVSRAKQARAGCLLWFAAVSAREAGAKVGGQSTSHTYFV